AALEPLAGHSVQDVERGDGRGLVGLVVGHEAAHPVGRHDLGRTEVARGEGGLPAAGGADEHDQRGLGDVEVQRAPRDSTTAWVGGPSSGSRAPTSWKAAVYPWTTATRSAQA